MKKRLFISCALFSLTLFASLFLYVNFIKRTKGFCLKKIVSYHEYHPKWDIGPLTSEQESLLNEISSQTFRYLGSGKECYAFESEDGKLVLKFFKQKHMHIRSIFNVWPFTKIPYLNMIQSAKVERRTHLRNQTFMSYLIGYNHFSDRTGLLYLHLNKTHNLHRKVTLLPINGGKVTVDLDNMEFLVQRKAITVLNYLDHLLQENKMKECKQAIGSILDLLITRSKSGISDFDNNCNRNIGFMDGRASLIDVGEFRLIPPTYPTASEFYDATDDLKEFLSKRYPELEEFLEIQIQKRIRHDL
ncbi:hypothetical protein [Simkania negevensis]|uniref:Uncharacterized protein n=1 Tax=Simkania negevensis (strain ATCC VR-1471 / DSM 27360 / Z) TaxID=331113 RepID=F8L838_SIMNZ|nr:hypothetical protein [Simkania negevensis]MCB1074622.1 hypothetical protein [Simkania sp.]CCB88944.1 putative uncharacterized protein [Simkania negevensis Z]